MRIFLSYPDNTGTKKTIRLSIAECKSTSSLLTLISSKLRVGREYMVVKLKNEPYYLRIIDGWPLSIYPLKNSSWVHVDILYDKMQAESVNGSPTGKLSTIGEELELEFDEEFLNNGTNPKLSFLSLFCVKAGEKSEYDWNKYFEESLEAFLNSTRSCSLEKMSEVIKQQPEVKDEQLLAKMMKKKTEYLVNQLGMCGRAAIHWAIQEKAQDIVEFLLIKSCDPNIVSLDEYTPLQLAVTLRCIPIIQTLLLHPRIDVNKVTSKGSVLHVAVKNSDLVIMKKVVECGVNLDLEDGNNNTALDVCKDPDIKAYLESKPQKIVEQLPYITRGKIWKVSSFANRHKQRLLIINPFTNQFYLYKDKDIDERQTLDSIIIVKKIENKSWLMKDIYEYFEVQTVNKKMIFCCRNKEIENHWIQQIEVARDFCENKKHKLKYPLDDQLIQIINDENKKIQVHKRKSAKNSTMKKDNRISIFDLELKEDEEQTYQKIQEKLSESLTSSHYANSEHEAECEDDLRDSEMLGSVVGGEKNVQSVHYRKTINNADFKIHDFRSSMNYNERYSPSVCFQHFQILRLLGNGSFGKVFLAKHRKTQKKFAMKVLNKKKLLTKKQLRYAVTESNILKKMDHPFVITLHYAFQTPLNLYMALDYCPFGDLAELLSEKDYFSEQVSRFYIAQIILAIEYLHKKKIIYRDLKPQNILVGADNFLRLTDFGLSRENNFALSFCGSPAYLSPEMLEKKGVGPETDIYGIGCVLYQMLIGEPPYFDEDIQRLFDNIKNAKIKFPSFVSKNSKNLINALLERNVKKRIGVKNFSEIKNHEFFKNFSWQNLQNLTIIPPNEILQSFQEEFQLEAANKCKFSDTDYDNPSNMLNRIKSFTFIREETQ